MSISKELETRLTKVGLTAAHIANLVKAGYDTDSVVISLAKRPEAFAKYAKCPPGVAEKASYAVVGPGGMSPEEVEAMDGATLAQEFAQGRTLKGAVADRVKELSGERVPLTGGQLNIKVLGEFLTYQIAQLRRTGTVPPYTGDSYNNVPLRPIANAFAIKGDKQVFDPFTGEALDERGANPARGSRKFNLKDPLTMTVVSYFADCRIKAGLNPEDADAVHFVLAAGRATAKAMNAAGPNPDADQLRTAIEECDSIPPSCQPIAIQALDLVLDPDGTGSAAIRKVAESRLAGGGNALGSGLAETLPEPYDVVILSAPGDNKYRDEIRVHMSMEIRRGLRYWDTSMIQGGQPSAAMKLHLINNAKMVALLLSPEFLAMHYDVLEAAYRSRDSGVRVIPITIKGSDWASTPIGGLRPLPDSRCSQYVDGRHIPIDTNLAEVRGPERDGLMANVIIPVFKTVIATFMKNRAAQEQSSGQQVVNYGGVGQQINIYNEPHTRSY